MQIVDNTSEFLAQLGFRHVFELVGSYASCKSSQLIEMFRMMFGTKRETKHG